MVRGTLGTSFFFLRSCRRQVFDGAFLFLYQFGEIRFFIIHFLVFCPLDAGSSLKITKKEYFFEKSVRF